MHRSLVELCRAWPHGVDAEKLRAHEEAEAVHREMERSGSSHVDLAQAKEPARREACCAVLARLCSASPSVLPSPSRARQAKIDVVEALSLLCAPEGPVEVDASPYTPRSQKASSP